MTNRSISSGSKTQTNNPVHDMQTKAISKTNGNVQSKPVKALKDKSSAAPKIIPPAQPLHPKEFPKPAAGKSIIKVGLDIDVQRLTATVRWDQLNPQAPREFKSADQLVEWVSQRVKEGHVVYSVYEACGFGYCLHNQLVQAGAISLVISPMVLDRSRRRKNDRLDSGQLCLR